MNDSNATPAETHRLLQTPLYDEARKLEARMVDFSGWEMAVQYSSIREEHEAVRQDAGVFDISHMGKFTLQGADVMQHLQTLVPTDLSKLEAGQAQYTVLLNDQGGIIDDLIVYYQGTDDDKRDRVVLIVNAATTSKDKYWLLDHLPQGEIGFEDVSRDRALFAVQGPNAAEKIQSLTAADLSNVGRFEHVETEVHGYPAFMARTGYTGEDGFEVMVEAKSAPKIWRALLAEGFTPCGLGARDTLRLEAALALYGQDIDDATTPLEAGLSWLVHLDRKQDFVGRSILEQQKQDGVERRLVGLQMQGRNIARHDYPVLHDGETVGRVTSGTLSPTLGYPIALAYVPQPLSKVGQELEVEIRGKTHPAKVVKRPFYRPGKS
jgi:aminomethyltransferase